MKLLAIFLLSITTLSTYSNHTEPLKNDSLNSVTDQPKKELAVSSNQAQNIIYIDSPKAISAYILNTEGEKMGVFKDNELNATKLPRGTYWINIEENHSIFRYPIVIE